MKHLFGRVITLVLITLALITLALITLVLITLGLRAGTREICKAAPFSVGQPLRGILQ